MKSFSKLILGLCVMMMATVTVGQTVKYQDIYRVKKKDTIYGIAKKYNITIDELMQANPDMQKTDYILKKDNQLIIPVHVEQKAAQTAAAPVAASNAAQTKTTTEEARTVRIGVMLPLHNVDGDGQRIHLYT